MASVANRIYEMSEEEAKLALLYMLNASAATLEDDDFCDVCHNSKACGSIFSAEKCMNKILDEVTEMTSAYMNNDIRKILVTVRRRCDD